MFAFRLATPDDADQIAGIVVGTSEGVVDHLFDKLIPGLSSAAILSAAFMKGEGAYRTDNVILSTKDDLITSLLFAYPAAEHKVPPLMESLLPKKRLDPARPVLERAIPDSLFINTIWLTESLRGKAMGDALLVEAGGRCRQIGVNRISLFCWNDNERALHFYARHGFELAEHIPQEQLPLDGHAKGGSLLCKTLNGG